MATQRRHLADLRPACDHRLFSCIDMPDAEVRPAAAALSVGLFGATGNAAGTAVVLAADDLAVLEMDDQVILLRHAVLSGTDLGAVPLAFAMVGAEGPAAIHADTGWLLLATGELRQ